MGAKCERYQPSWVRFGGERRFEGFGKTWNEGGIRLFVVRGLLGECVWREL